MASKKQTSVDKAQTTDVAAYKDYSGFEGRGFQNQTQDDFAIPFINVLQSKSPEVEDGNPERIEGAKAGMLINTITKELFETPVEVVPVITRHRYVEFIPRKQGGGLVGFHAPNSDIIKEAKARNQASGGKWGKYYTKDGNELVETFEVFVVLSNDGQPNGYGVMPFSSTKIKSYKHLMGRLNSYQIVMEDGRRINPPMFAHLVRIDTVFSQNSEGTWFKTTMQPAVENDVEKSLLDTNDPRFQMGAELEKLVAEGNADADYSTQQASGEGDGSEDLPF